jgi:hypothetical protein
VDNSLAYYIALKKVGVPVEMHLYAQGGHGVWAAAHGVSHYRMASVSEEVPRDHRNDSEAIRICESGILVKRTRSRSPLASSGPLLRHAMDRAEAQH